MGANPTMPAGASGSCQAIGLNPLPGVGLVSCFLARDKDLVDSRDHNTADWHGFGLEEIDDLAVVACGTS